MRGISQVMIIVLKFSKIYSSRSKPMSIDIVHFKSLMEQKKSWYCQEGLCLYYEEAKYTTQYCPKKQHNYKIRSIIAQKDNVSKNEFYQQ